MPYRRLFVLVEGPDDVRFFDKIIKPKLQKKYNLVEIRPYSTWKKEKIDNFLRGIKAMNACYIYVTDINTARCVTTKKQEIEGKLKTIDRDRIAVVIKEIESWYLAGLSNAEVEKFKIPTFSVTDNITKEQFDSLVPKKFKNSRIDFMSEILKCFSTEIAKQKNKSFRYVIEKYNCEVY